VNHDNDRYITVDEAALMLRCSTTTVYRHIRRGDLRAHRFGRRWLIDRRDLEAAIAVD